MVSSNSSRSETITYLQNSQTYEKLNSLYITTGIQNIWDGSCGSEDSITRLDNLLWKWNSGILLGNIEYINKLSRGIEKVTTIAFSLQTLSISIPNDYPNYKKSYSPFNEVFANANPGGE